MWDLREDLILLLHFHGYRQFIISKHEKQKKNKNTWHQKIIFFYFLVELVLFYFFYFKKEDWFPSRKSSYMSWLLYYSFSMKSTIKDGSNNLLIHFDLPFFWQTLNNDSLNIYITIRSFNRRCPLFIHLIF